MLCASDRFLHFLCLLLEPAKGLRKIHAHFPAVPTHDGEAESVGKESSTGFGALEEGLISS